MVREPDVYLDSRADEAQAGCSLERDAPLLASVAEKSGDQACKCVQKQAFDSENLSSSASLLGKLISREKGVWCARHSMRYKPKRSTAQKQVGNW
jgi:hypothetical protein